MKRNYSVHSEFKYCTKDVQIFAFFRLEKFLLVRLRFQMEKMLNYGIMAQIKYYFIALLNAISTPKTSFVQPHLLLFLDSKTGLR